MNKKPLIVALDVETFEEARRIIDVLSPAVQIFKIGSQLFTACGPVVVRHLTAQGKDVFLDLKFHDIPNTVAKAIESVVALNVEVHKAVDQTKKGNVILCTLHTQGGEEMMKAAALAAARKAKELNVKRPQIVGVTVLTSDAKGANVPALVLERAQLAKKSGLDGIVCSSEETKLVREELGKDFVIITPGIRPSGADKDDQKRVTTPKEAMENGSSYLVVGRPILESANPLQAAQSILKEIAS